LQRALPIAEAEDVSRPEGWGDVVPAGVEAGRVRSGGIEYEADEVVWGDFSIGRSKADVYAECVGAVLQDLIEAIENPAHSQRITLEDGLRSLEIAVRATGFARLR